MSKIGTPEGQRSTSTPKLNWGSGPSQKGARGGFKIGSRGSEGGQGARGGFTKGSEKQKSGKK